MIQKIDRLFCRFFFSIHYFCLFFTIGVYLKQADARHAMCHFAGHLKLEQYAQAESDIRHALARWSDNALIWANYGLLFGRMALNGFRDGTVDSSRCLLYNRAIDSYKKALLIHRSDGCFHHNLAWLYYCLKRNQIALCHIDSAVRLDPHISIYHISRGLLLEKFGQTHLAFESFARAVCLSPEIVDSHFFHDVEKKYPHRSARLLLTCIRRIDAKVKKKYNPILDARLAKLMLRNGQHGKARSKLQIVIHQLPNLNRPYLYLGWLAENSGDLAEAELRYKQARLLDRSDFLPLLRLAELSDRTAGSTDALCFFLETLTVWSNIYSEHALRCARLYLNSGHSSYSHGLVQDDIFPPGLSHYCEPEIDLEYLISRCTELSASNRSLNYRYFTDESLIFNPEAVGDFDSRIFSLESD